MRIGTRILYAEEVEYWNAELLQISVYHGMDKNIEMMEKTARACREAGTRYVIHPVRFSLLQEETLKDVLFMAECTDLSLILHDERTPEGERISGRNETRFRHALEELQAVTHVSFENAVDTGDIHWFWDTFAESVTLDIGHVESSGLDSVEFVNALDEADLQKIQFVHIHRNNGLRGGITDHWPLRADCREISALKSLLNVKRDINVILEINEIEQINQSLDILRSLRDSL
jgi:sugar phosphate isomerase/epimerase